METGCMIYNYVYTIQIGNSNNFRNNDRINVRYSDNDSQCGIKQNVLQPQYGNSCEIQNGPFQSNTGTIVTYNRQDNSCLNTPLDSGAIGLILAVGALGVFMIKKFN